jgi:protein TonB
MRNSNKIKAAVILSIAVHLLFIGLINIKNDTFSVTKKRLIPVDYYELKPEAKVPKKKTVKKSKKEIKPEKKKIKKLAKTEKPKPKKEKLVLKPPPVVVAEPVKKREPEESVKKVQVKKVDTPAKLDKPVTEPVKKKVAKSKREPLPVAPKGAKKIVADKKPPSERPVVEAPEVEPKGSDDIKIARLIPSIERLEELERLEREHTRGIPGSEIESIRLDSVDVRYVSYLDHIKLAIELTWNYPEEAARRGIQGEGVLSFTIGSTGELKEVRLLNTTGSKILDKRFIRAVSMASPFPPLPENITARNLKIVATYRYILSIVY